MISSLCKCVLESHWYFHFITNCYQKNYLKKKGPCCEVWICSTISKPKFRSLRSVSGQRLHQQGCRQRDLRPFSLFIRMCCAWHQVCVVQMYSICFTWDHWPDTHKFITRTFVFWNSWIRLSCFYNSVQQQNNNGSFSARTHTQYKTLPIFVHVFVRISLAHYITFVKINPS